MGLLHTFDIVEMYPFLHGLSVGRDSLEIVLHLVSLIDYGPHFVLSVFIYEYRGHFEYGLRVEIVSRISDGDHCIDVACDDFKHLRIAFDLYIFVHLRHFGGRGTSCRRHSGKEDAEDSVVSCHTVQVNMSFRRR